MIYDTLNNLPNYLGLCSSLDSVIEFIMARDINNLPAGRTRIDGNKAVVMVSTVTPQASDKAPFVRHDNHLTLETDLEGSELFEVSLGEACGKLKKAVFTMELDPDEEDETEAE